MMAKKTRQLCWRMLMAKRDRLGNNSSECKSKDIPKQSLQSLLDTNSPVVDDNVGHPSLVRRENLEGVISDQNKDLEKKSEESYISIVKTIVYISKENLRELRKNKEKIRDEFVRYFKKLITTQIVILFIFILLKGFVNFKIEDNVIIAFMTSIFVETLSCVVIMITFAFKSKEEVTIINTLNTVVETFQKFKKTSK